MNIALIVHITQVSAKQSLKSDVNRDEVVEDIQKTTTEGKNHRNSVYEWQSSREIVLRE